MELLPFELLLLFELDEPPSLLGVGVGLLVGSGVVEGDGLGVIEGLALGETIGVEQGVGLGEQLKIGGKQPELGVGVGFIRQNSSGNGGQPGKLGEGKASNA